SPGQAGRSSGGAAGITSSFGGGMRERRSYRACLGAALLFASVPAQAQTPGPQFINPPGLSRPTGYTHVVVSADGRTAYVAGQVAFDSTGAVVGGSNFQAQADQVF